MVKGWWYVATACLMVGMAGCATQPAMNITVNTDASADQDQVIKGVKMIESGQIQAAIDGPLTDVIDRYEKKYANSPDRIYSARGPIQSLLYMMTVANENKTKAPADRRNGLAVDAAWGMAYWARGYGYSDMARYPEAEADLEKALALSPQDAQYTGELAYVYQRQQRWNESLALYVAMPGMVPLMDGWTEPMQNEFQCKAYRGQGYDLVELKRYDEAVAAYKECLKIIPGEPTSTGELEYIKGVRAKGG